MSKKIILIILVIILILISFFAFSSISSKSLAQSQNQTVKTNIVVETVPQSSVSRTVLDKVQSSWPWYVTRASGLIAGLLLFILILSGLGFITGQAYNFLEPITAWASHKALGITLGISILLHIGALYFDSFVTFDLQSIFIPFVSNYKPIIIFGISFGSLFVALGVLALYVILAIILTSLFWIEKKPKTWKLTHLLSYIAMIFVFVHALYLGTDLASGVLRYVWIGLILILAVFSLMRLRRARIL
jgi:hypothetical protein